MVGRPIDQVFPKRDVPIGDVVLTVEGLSNATEFADISFELRKGEILGFYGLVGAGRIGGDAGPVRHDADRRAGRVTLEGQAARASARPADAIAAGISYVPEDRQDAGRDPVARHPGERDARQSLAKHVRGLSPVARRRSGSTTRGARAAARRSRRPTGTQRLAELSGGNQQKVVIAKWLATRPKVIDSRRADQGHRRRLEGGRA